MKIQDTVGRSMLVDLMYKDASRWMLAPEHKLKGRGTRYLEVPLGSQVAIKIESLTGADVLVFENGKQVLSTSVPPRTQYISADKNGLAFHFREEGDTTPGTKVTDMKVHADNTPVANGDENSDLFAGSADTSYCPPEAPKGHGLMYVIVRFAKQNDPHGEPPQEEFECAFQMMDTQDAEEHFAANFHLIEQAPALPNPLNPFSREPATDKELAARPCIHCTFGGHDHKH